MKTQKEIEFDNNFASWVRFVILLGWFVFSSYWLITGHLSNNQLNKENNELRQKLHECNTKTK